MFGVSSTQAQTSECLIIDLNTSCVSVAVGSNICAYLSIPLPNIASRGLLFMCTNMISFPYMYIMFLYSCALFPCSDAQKCWVSQQIAILFFVLFRFLYCNS